MKEHILQILQQIEQGYDVKILYACEAGSRTWGISSEESDYDVRFIYIHKIDWYLSIDQKRDVLELPVHDDVNIAINPLVDISGWELSKALRLFRKSNPALLEWLHSDIIYFQAFSFINKTRKLEPRIFSPIPCMHHYVKMAKGNFKRIQEKGPDVKTYINVIRPLLIANFLEKHQKLGKLDLPFLLNHLLPAGETKEALEYLLKLKMTGEKLTQQVAGINGYIEEQIEHLDHYISGLDYHGENHTEKLNQLFRETLTEVWQS